MANIKISQLPAAASASGTQEFETNDSGTSKKVTGNQLKTFVKSGLVASDVTDLTATATELNTLDGITASTAELNILGGATTSTTELNHLTGVTSNVQTQLDTKYDSGDIATQAQAEARTDNTTLMTPLRVAQANTKSIGDSTLGAGQTWQDVSASRAVSTSYQNTTGKPIQLAIRLSNSTDRSVQVSSNNSTWIQIGTSYSSWWPFTYVVIPVGYYYRVNGSASILNWAELR